MTWLNQQGKTKRCPCWPRHNLRKTVSGAFFKTLRTQKFGLWGFEPCHGSGFVNSLGK